MIMMGDGCNADGDTRTWGVNIGVLNCVQSFTANAASSGAASIRGTSICSDEGTMGGMNACECPNNN